MGMRELPDKTVGKQPGRVLRMPKPTDVPRRNQHREPEGRGDEDGGAARRAALYNSLPLHFRVAPETRNADGITAFLFFLVLAAFAIWRLVH